MASGAALTPAVIATWPVPNYVDPVSKRDSIDAAVYTTSIIMICFVIARIFVRANQKSGLGADDWIMVAAAVFGIATAGTILALSSNSLGRHLYDVEPVWLVRFAKLNLSSLTMYNVSMTLTKVSVCMTYLNLFPSRTNRLFCWTMIGYQVLWGVITSVLYILQCIPIQSLWDPTITDKTCLDTQLLLTASASLNVLSDFLIFLWPVAPLWRIKLPLSQRLHLVTVFSFGVLTCVGGLFKVIWAQDYFKTWDITWVASRVTIALSIEYNIGIMSGCLPCLRPFLAILAPRIFAGTSASHSGNAATPVGGSWRKSPFRSKNFDSIKLDTNEAQEYDENYEFTDAQHARAARTQVNGGKQVPQANIDIAPGPGIQVTTHTSIRDRYGPPGVVTHDATSEEWIMQ